MLQFLHSGFDEVFPLWALSAVASGGLDWTSKDIGQVHTLVLLSCCCLGCLTTVQYSTAVNSLRLHRRACPGLVLYTMFGKAFCPQFLPYRVCCIGTAIALSVSVMSTVSRVRNNLLLFLVALPALPSRVMEAPTCFWRCPASF